MQIPDPTTLGSVVRMRRQELGLSQTQLADAVGTTRQWLSRFEQATNDVSLSIMFAILEALDLSLDVSGLGSPAVATVPVVDPNEPSDSVVTPPANPETGTDRFALLRSRDALAGLRLPGAVPPARPRDPGPTPEFEPEVRHATVPDPAVTAKAAHRLDQDIARIKMSSLFKR